MTLYKFDNPELINRYEMRREFDLMDFDDCLDIVQEWESIANPDNSDLWVWETALDTVIKGVWPMLRRFPPEFDGMVYSPSPKTFEERTGLCFSEFITTAACNAHDIAYEIGNSDRFDTLTENQAEDMYNDYAYDGYVWIIRGQTVTPMRVGDIVYIRVDSEGFKFPLTRFCHYEIKIIKGEIVHPAKH